MTQFDDLVGGGAPAIRALVGRHETLELDFEERGASDKDTKKVFGKALSAFANSMGGLIVWGVTCKKDRNGIDQVIGFRLIGGLAKFASDMRDWAVEGAMPHLADVRVEAVEEGGDHGFLLIEVPRSERRPHHCEFGGKGYYRRAGASSRRMEHFEIEDAFRRISSPSLNLEYRVGNGGSSVHGIVGGAMRAEASVTLLLSLRNTSRASARSAYISTSPLGLAPNRNVAAANSITIRNQPPLWFFEIEPATIHPDVSRLVAPLEIKLDLVLQDQTWLARREQLDLAMKPRAVGYGCLDTPMQTDTIQPTEAEILDAVDVAPRHPVIVPR